MSPARRPRDLLARAIGGRRSAPEAGTTSPQTLLELARRGPAPLAQGATAAGGALRVAVLIPPFRRGSGGHATIVHLLRELVAIGHDVSLWLEDWEGRHAAEPAALVRSSFAEFFGAEGLSLHPDLSGWGGADVVLATGWQTVPRALLLEGVRARAYLVQDHEPDFYGASAQAIWAEQTYRAGLHCIAASAWLADLLRSRYGASTTHFDLAVDAEVYHPGPHDRREDLIVFYARAATPRRAVPLGLLALEELALRRGALQIALFGETSPLPARFGHEHLGVLSEPELARLYSRATVGMVLSLTNPSLVSLQMMACGLPSVELATESMLASFGRDGPLSLADPDPLSLCSAIEHLLDSAAARERASAAGVAVMSSRSWEAAARQLEAGLRLALAQAGGNPTT